MPSASTYEQTTKEVLEMNKSSPNKHVLIALLGLVAIAFIFLIVPLNTSRPYTASMSLWQKLVEFNVSINNPTAVPNTPVTNITNNPYGGYHYPVQPTAAPELWGLAIDKLSTRSGPSPGHTDMGTYNMKGQYVKVLSRAWDSTNGIWWVKCEIPYQSETLTVWTGYKRFDSRTLPIDSIPLE